MEGRPNLPEEGFWGPGPGFEKGSLVVGGGLEMGGVGFGRPECGCVRNLSIVDARPSNGCCWASPGPKPATSCPTSSPAAW